MWYIGQKIECINSIFHPSVYDWGPEIPIEGKVYVIEDIDMAPHFKTRKPGVGFHLVGVANKTWFSAWRFIPLDNAELVDSGEYPEKKNDRIGVATASSGD
jgi:hypothetical protein